MILPPSDFKVQFNFMEDRYKLPYRKVPAYESIGTGSFFDNINPGKTKELIDEMLDWAKNYTSGCKIINFLDKKPETMEELILSETGRALFLPTTAEGFPRADPDKRIITEVMFKQYLESIGVEPDDLDNACAAFINSKREEGIFSDMWIPILFQEYVIGYIHIWNSKVGRVPFDYTMLDKMRDFARLLAFSLKENGNFESSKLPSEPFHGNIIDISASGLLFAHPESDLCSSLMVNVNLVARIITSKRVIATIVTITRRFKDKTTMYFGCCFNEMLPEDMRFIFELIYGKSSTIEQAAILLSGHV
jgi:hypothetical protein